MICFELPTSVPSSTLSQTALCCENSSSAFSLTVFCHCLLQNTSMFVPIKDHI